MSENIDYLYSREINEDYRAELLAEKEAEWFAVFEKRMSEFGIHKPTILIIWNQINCVENFDRLIKTLETLSIGTTEEIAKDLSRYLALEFAPTKCTSVIGALNHLFSKEIKRSIESHLKQEVANNG